jgi:peptidoglycan/xylan/chitin deacetylase (PgdA/CDA1 family)
MAGYCLETETLVNNEILLNILHKYTLLKHKETFMKKRSFLRWPNYRLKAVTLSYDDSVSHNVKLMEIMDKYGLKGTFNLNSGLWANAEGEYNLTKAKATALYKNSKHEVAVHGLKHLSLSEVDEAMAVNDVISDKKNLENMVGYIISGMAYANGFYNDSVLEIIKKCGIKYARTVEQTESFDLPENWLCWDSTCRHANPKLMELAKEFIEAGAGCNFWWDTPRLFYLWGHSYEFDHANNWNLIEEFAKYIGNREDVWYATNGEIYAYVQAFDNLQFSADGSLVYNPSAIDVYICYFEKNYLIPAGKTIAL